MAHNKYTAKHRQSAKRIYSAHPGYDLLEKKTTNIVDMCPNWCGKKTPQIMIKFSHRATKRGDRWGTLLTVGYKCQKCHGVYFSRAWKQNHQRKMFPDMMNVGEK
jgi:hypothetical protein